MSGSYAGVFVHNFPSRVSDMHVLVVRDERFRDVKMAGGMAEKISGSDQLETPEEIMKREANSEMGVQVRAARPVFHETKKDRDGVGIHHRYFFLATEVSGLPDLGSEPRKVTETNPSDGSVERLICFWMPLREVADRLFRGQHKAFGAILSALSVDSKMGRDFCMSFGDLLNRFPDPREK